MARYRQFLCAFWDDPDVEEYDPHQKLLYAYFFTNKSTTESGIYPLTIKKMSDYTGIPQQKVKVILRGGIRNIYYDWQRKIIFVAKFVHHNYRGNPFKLRQSIANDMHNYPTPLWSEFEKEYPDLYAIITEENKDLMKTLRSLGNGINDIETDIDNDNDKERIDKRGHFVKPMIDEVRAYCQERKNRVDPEKFFNYYESVGWRVGRNPMKDWKAAVRTWEKNDNAKTPSAAVSFSITSFDKARDLLRKDRTTTAMLQCLRELSHKDCEELVEWCNGPEGKELHIDALYSRAKKIFKGKEKL